MNREDQDQPPYFRDKVVFKYGTIQRSAEEVEDQGKMQNGDANRNPVLYEVLNFHNGPLEFKAICFLPPGESVFLKIEDVAMTRFKSVANTILTEEDVKVFALVVLEDGGRRYVPLSIMDVHERNLLTFVYEREDAEEDATEFVEGILIAGRILKSSYIMLESRKLDDVADWPLTEGEPTLYLGKNVLDLPDNKRATLTVETVLNVEGPKPTSEVSSMPLSHLKKYTESAPCRTLFELREWGLSSDREDTVIQRIQELSNQYIEGNLEALGVSELCEALMQAYRYTKFSFSEEIPRDVILAPLVAKVLDALKFDVQDTCYRLLSVLTRDSGICYMVMFDMNFGAALVEKLVSPTLRRWTQKEPMLDVLISMISHGNCMRRFIAAGSGNDEGSLCDVLLLGVGELPRFSFPNFQERLQAIGERCEVFSALSKVETLNHNVQAKISDNDGPQYYHLQTLIHGINEVIAIFQRRHEEELAPNSTRVIEGLSQYDISYLRETNLPGIMLVLMRSLHRHLERFPIPPLHVNTMLEKPLWLIEKYSKFIDFEDCLLSMVDIGDLVNSIGLSNLVQGGIYTYPHASNFKNICEAAAIRTIMPKMFSVLLSKRSCPQVVSAMYRIWSEYPCSLKSLTDILSEDFALDAVNGIVFDAVSALKAKATLKTTPQENMELWQLVNLICGLIEKDESGKLLYIAGRRLLSSLDEFLAIFENNGKLMLDRRLQSLENMRNNLRQLYDSPALNGDMGFDKTLESVGSFLEQVLGSCRLKLFPDTLKHSLAKVSHMYTMSLINDKLCTGVFLADPQQIKTITKSVVTERLSTAYSCGGEDIELHDVHWAPCEAFVTRGRQLGVPDHKIGHYNNCYLFIVPPELLPEKVVLGLRMLHFASTLKSSSTLFSDLLRDMKNTDILFRIWVHAVASLAPDNDTMMNVEMGAFKSLVGYQWFVSSEKVIPVIISIVQTLYVSMHHLSGDNYSPEAINKPRNVRGVSLRYINDDLLTLIILSITGVVSNRRWYVEREAGSSARKCIRWLCKLISYWYHRYQKSQGYIMNRLMSAYVSLPRMADGVAMLIVSCGPQLIQNCNVEMETYNPDEPPLENGTRVIFEGKEYFIRIKENQPLVDDDVPNAAFWKLLRRVESIKPQVLADFMCCVASRSYTTNPSTLVLTSEMARYLIANGNPLMPLLCEVSNKCFEECVKAKAEPSSVKKPSGKAYTLLTFWTLIAKELVADIERTSTSLLQVIYWILEFFNKFAKGSELMSEGCCRMLFEGYTYLFQSHNKFWELHQAALAIHSDFNNYMALITEAVAWICKTLNSFKVVGIVSAQTDTTKDSKVESSHVELYDNTKSVGEPLVSWESVLMGFIALKASFTVPFTALNVLYTVLSGPMELIGKIINKQIDSEIVKVTPSARLGLSATVKQLCEALVQPTYADCDKVSNPDSTIHLMILEELYGICESIHLTGSSQHAFICSLIHGNTNSTEIPRMITSGNDLRKTKEVSHNQADIYSDMITSSRSASGKDTDNQTETELSTAPGDTFKCVTDALMTFINKLGSKLDSQSADRKDNIVLSAQIANAMLIINAFENLARVIPTDAMERPLPQTLPGYIFLKVKSSKSLFSHYFDDKFSKAGNGQVLVRSLISRIMAMIKSENWASNTCLVNQNIASNSGIGDTSAPRWLSSCFRFNGSKEAIEIWKAVRFLSKTKLLFADEMMCYAPYKNRKQDKSLPNDSIRYIRSASTRAPSKHVDAYESQKAGVMSEDDENLLNQANIEKAVSKLNGVITSQTWKDFDNDLIANGLNLRSILVNPSLLNDYSARATFLHALSRHLLIKELLISVGVDVR